MNPPGEARPRGKTSLRCPLGEPACQHLTELGRIRSEIDRLALEVRTDALTGLFNYRHFCDLLDQEVERADRSGLPVTLVMADLDHFKEVNDRWGHEAGNRVLQGVAETLRAGVRRIDAVCRYGGEELVLILPATPLLRGVKVAERLRACVEEGEMEHRGEPLQITASFGVAVYPGRGIADAAALVARTDAELYRAKAEGRNRVCHRPEPMVVSETRVTADEKKFLLE
jgi:diguanylate cyclase (GGDEF)-like protein